MKWIILDEITESGQRSLSLTFQPNPKIVRFLLSKEGTEWLERAAGLGRTPEATLSDLSYLRRHLSPDQAAAVFEQVQLRTRAATRFEEAKQMLFTATGLQQSTHPAVAAYRAERFRGRTVVADLGCGLGSDTIAMARLVDHVLAIDRDPTRLLFARHNTSVFGVMEKVGFVQADILALPCVSHTMTSFCDPGRRTAEGKRTYRPRDYEPPLPLLRERMRAAKGLAIKVAPGISYEALPPVDEVEIISHFGQVKEATLWYGDLATPMVRRRATLLPSGITVTDAQPSKGCPVKSVGHYLYEPDGAIIRAGLVQHVAMLLGLWQIDRQIAYLSGDVALESPLVRGFAVEEQLPFGLKPLRRRLRELRVGNLEIKKRGVALDPDVFRRRLKLRGSESKTLIITRIGAKPIAFICQRKRQGMSC
jgi:SAM-dependent methyltransferase